MLKIYSYIFLFFVFFFCSTPSYSQTSEPFTHPFKCSKKYQFKGLEGSRPVDKCIDQNNISNLGALKIDEFETLRVSNISNFELSFQELEGIFSKKEFYLQINGLCAGECARLVAPLARTINLEKGAIIALTDSSIQTRLGHLATSLQSGSFNQSQEGNSISGNEMLAINRQFKKNHVEKHISEIKLLSQSEISATHLMLHTFTKEHLRNTSFSNCSLTTTPLGIVLTQDYLLDNLFIFNDDYQLPSKKEIILAFEKSKFFPSTLTYSYENRPFLKCGGKP